MEGVILGLAVELLKAVAGALVKCLVDHAAEGIRARKKGPDAPKHLKRP